MENIAFFFHILGAMLFVAGIVVAGVAFEAARRQRRPSEIALLLGLTRVGVVLVAVGTVLAGVFGLWLVHLWKWGYGAGWVDASIVLFLVVIGLGGVGGRRPKEARLLASRLAEHDVASDSELRALLDDRVSRAENYGSLLLVLVIIALMVFKP
jgi:MFS family permease